MIYLGPEPIDTQALLDSAYLPAAGAVVLFVGITREFTDGERTESLDYDAYLPMAEQELKKLEQQARQRWPLCQCGIVHRLGRVAISQPSVAVVVSAPHRDEAFAAGKWLIDELKVRVPIWKKEHAGGGASRWVHPTGQRPGVSSDG